MKRWKKEEGEESHFHRVRKRRRKMRRKGRKRRRRKKGRKRSYLWRRGRKR